MTLPDPSDLPFLEVAAASRADVLVTGDIKHLRPRRGRQDSVVATPAGFVSRWAG